MLDHYLLRAVPQDEKLAAAVAKDARLRARYDRLQKAFEPKAE